MTNPDLRAQLRLRPVNRQRHLNATLDQLVPPDDEVRCVNDFVQQLDTAVLEQAIRSRVGTAGAPAFDPKVLIGVLLFGLRRGIASFRALEALCDRHLAFMWLCGQDAPNDHTLSTFYATHGSWVEATLIDVLTALREQDLVTYEDLALDGRKLRAHASKDRVHRAPTLAAHREEAVQRVERLRQQRDVKVDDWNQQKAAQLRAAEDQQQRLEAALQTVQRCSQERASSGRSEPSATRASVTDPDAPKMKLADGSYQLAYNVQTVTDLASGLIVTIAVADQACDNGLFAPLVAQAEAHTSVPVNQVLADAGYSSQADVQALEEQGVTVLMPPKNEAKEPSQGRDPYAPKRRDTPEVQRWRARLGDDWYRAVYRRRAPVAEGVHAQPSNRGFRQFRLRGLLKVRTEVWWHALAHNFAVRLRHQWLSRDELRPVTA